MFVRCHLYLSWLLKVVDDVLPGFLVDTAAFAEVFGQERSHARDSFGLQKVIVILLILTCDVVLNFLGQVQYLGLIFRMVFILEM